MKNRGFEITTHPNNENLNLIVTCSVKDVTEHRMIYRISRLSRSGKPLVVAGCLPKADPTRAQLASPHAHLTFGPNSIDKTAGIIVFAIAGNKMTALADSISDKTNVPRVRVNPVISIVPNSNTIHECIQLLPNQTGQGLAEKLPNWRHSETGQRRTISRMAVKKSGLPLLITGATEKTQGAILWIC